MTTDQNSHRETCPCGAVLELGFYHLSKVEPWREAHRVCRENRVDALVAERDEALRLRDKSDEAHHREYTGRIAAEADRDTLAAALRDIKAWSDAARLQNPKDALADISRIVAAALARLEGNPE